MSSQEEQGITDEKLTRVMNSVVKINTTSAGAVEKTSSLFDHPHPSTPLLAVQKSLFEIYRETVTAIDTVEKTIDEMDGDRELPF